MLKSEILRLSKKAIRQETASMKGAANNARKQITLLRQQVQKLEKEVLALRRTQPKPSSREHSSETQNVRISAKGIHSLRKRLGLNAEDFGKLAGVSVATIYSWEGGKTKPRPTQRSELGKLRSIGKREAMARLQSGKPSIGDRGKALTDT